MPSATAVTQPFGTAATVPVDRDPDVEQRSLDTLFAAFARGDAAAGSGARESDGPAPHGPETQDVERR
jgi:hypothetical protein